MYNQYYEGGSIMKKRVVIIGAGPAGLSCAYNLLKKNNDVLVTVIEEDSQVGGISKTINYKNNRLDIGGHRFFTKNSEVEKLWFDILPLQGKPARDDLILGTSREYTLDGVDPEVEDEVMLIRNRVSRIFYNKSFFDYPVNLNLKTIRNMGFSTTCSCAASYIKASLFKLDETSLENFYINRFGWKLYSMFFEGYTEKVWGRLPAEIDASWGSQRVKGISIRKVIGDYMHRLFKISDKKKEISLIEEFYYPKYGPGQFYELLADEIVKMGGVIITNSRVVKINNTVDEVHSISYMKDNKKYDLLCDVLVSSMPLKDLIKEMNGVPKEIKKISNNLPYRDFVTVGVLIPKLDLLNNKKNKTIHGGISDNWIYVQDTNVKVGRIQIFNNWSPYMVENPIDTVWLGMEYFCNENDEFWNKSDSELKILAVGELKKIGFCSEKALDSVVIKVKKAYPAYFDTYNRIGDVRSYLDGFSNLYCIGRNGTHSYNNMDHSIYSGMVCADMIINQDKEFSKLWNINIDKSYQEEK